MKNSLDELLLVLETLRAEKHPEIPADVIKTIDLGHMIVQEMTLNRIDSEHTTIDKGAN